VKGRGIKKGSITGDLLATIEVQVPQKIEDEASEALKKFADATASHDVRMEFRAKASQ
jgi:molecular chaperone DnaJ